MSLAPPPPGIASSPSPARTPRSAHLSRSASVIVTSRRPSVHLVVPPVQPQLSRPITFALPPPTSHAHGTGALASPTTPSHERANPLSPSSANASPTSFLNRLSRKLSVGRTQLVRRVSKGKNTSPAASKPVSVHAADKENRTSLEAVAVAPAPGPSLQRGTRVSATTMLRSKSEGKRAPRLPVEEQKMQELISRANGFVESPIPGGAAGETGTVAAGDGRSYVGSYYWSDSLGLCWDGREEVRPDTTFAFQRYTSDADEIAKRAVYASTLSSFPPRPPLRPRTLELTPARQIIAEYRATHSPITPGTRSRSRALSDAETAVGSPTPNSRLLTPLDMDNLTTRPPSPTTIGPTDPFEAAPHDNATSPASPSSPSSHMSPLSAAAAHAARSYASSSASSVASGAGERFRFGSGSETSGGGGGPCVLSAPSPIGLGAHGRADSATSLESMGGQAPFGIGVGARPLAAGDKLRAPRGMQRFQLVDAGPVPKPSGANDDGASSVVDVDEWKECE
ncbi:hypothetical protein JCM8208_006662 [Rhodotorula glutinis]